MGRTSDAKNRLIATAQNLFWERSYRNVGVNEICEQAGVKPGSFYYFFPSKNALALEALEDGWQQFQSHALEPAFAMNVAPLDRITKLFQIIYDDHSAMQEQNKRILGCLFGSFVGELGEQDELIRQRIETVFTEIRKYFESALEDAIALGLVNIEFEDVPTCAEALLAFYEGALLIARAKNDAEIIRELTPHALKLLSG